jgi:hypothetical protein
MRLLGKLISKAKLSPWNNIIQNNTPDREKCNIRIRKLNIKRVENRPIGTTSIISAQGVAKVCHKKLPRPIADSNRVSNQISQTSLRGSPSRHSLLDSKTAANMKIKFVVALSGSAQNRSSLRSQ